MRMMFKCGSIVESYSMVSATEIRIFAKQTIPAAPTKNDMTGSSRFSFLRISGMAKTTENNANMTIENMKSTKKSGYFYRGYLALVFFRQARSSVCLTSAANRETSVPTPPTAKKTKSRMCSFILSVIFYNRFAVA